MKQIFLLVKLLLRIVINTNTERGARGRGEEGMRERWERGRKKRQGRGEGGDLIKSN